MERTNNNLIIRWRNRGYREEEKQRTISPKIKIKAKEGGGGGRNSKKKGAGNKKRVLLRTKSETHPPRARGPWGPMKKK